MSFHDPGSELSAINRSANRRPMRVSRDLMAVLTEARAVSAASGGVFDVTVGPLAVQAGALPRPDAPDPDPAADWRDVELDPDRRAVSFRRPLWIDLGGVAKGYAVDRATAVLRRHGVAQGCVNAGGDLRVFGPQSEMVALDMGAAPESAARAVELSNRSLASSGRLGRRREALAAHFDPATRRRPPRRFVTVIADRCIHADALTKVVLARGHAADGLLARFGARAAICSAQFQWSMGGAAC